MSNPDQTVNADTSKTKAVATAVTGRLMYVGPNRAYNLPVMYNQVFVATTPPPMFTEVAKALPHFKSCFVGIADLGKALAELKDRSSTLAKAAAKVARETLEIRSREITLAQFITEKTEAEKAANGGK